MAISSVSDGNAAAASDLNQYKNALEGAATSTWLLKAATTTHFQIQLADNAGSYELKVLDSDGVAVARIDSNGNLTLSGSFSPSTLVLPTSASPSQTAEGSIVWDTNDDVLTIGDGSSRKTFYPGASKYKYKTAAQDFTTTTFANVTATSGNLAASVLTGLAYEIDFHVFVTAVGTVGSGGFKWAITFPGTPTYIQVYMSLPYSDATVNYLTYTNVGTPTSGTNLLGLNGGDPGSAAGILTGWVQIKVVIISAADGSVTLQAAQNAAAGTSTIGEAYMSSSLIVADA